MTIEKLNNIPKFTILILEDMAQVRAKLISDLRTLKFNGIILEAESLASASDFILKGKIHLIICDLNLPDGTGLDFLKALHQNSKFSNIPFIMCTTVSEVGQILEAVKNGAREYIIKPWNITELSEKINFVINVG
jgi:DNA-binding response OmpR family regulator